MNCTYHRAIKATPYQVLFSWPPNFHRLDVHNRNILIGDINDQEIEDEQDNQLINEETQQLRDEITVHESMVQATMETRPLSRAISPVIPSSFSPSSFSPKFLYSRR